MNVTEPIIQAALLGTANREFVPGAFPESLQTLVDGIRGKAEDTESFLYMTAASAFAYRRAGWEPAGAEGIVPVETAPEEELPYFDKGRSQLFPDSTAHAICWPTPTVWRMGRENHFTRIPPAAYPACL